MHKRGVALVIGLMVILVLSILGSVIISRSISEARAARRYVESTQAFWLAEAGLNQALKNLRDGSSASIYPTRLPAGADRGYSATISGASSPWTVTAYGFVPFYSPHRAEYSLQAMILKEPSTPLEFFNAAIYSGGDVILKGSSYSVDGDLRYAATISGDTSHVTGDITNDPSISPLASLDFAQLRTISQSQGNYHDAYHLEGPFPVSFWYDQPNNIPNVVFIEGSLTLKGNESAAGFFVVGGEVTYDATVNGNVGVAGCIYTRGNFTIKGGGNSLNIDGGVWTGESATLDGNAKITYNSDYMSAIQGLGINTRAQLTSWKDNKNPYALQQ